MISPPIEWPTSAIRVTGDRPRLDQPLQQRGQGDAVLPQAEAGVGAQEDRGPARARRASRRTSCRRARGRGSSTTRSRRARAGRRRPGRWRPGTPRPGRRRRGRRRARRRGPPSGSPAAAARAASRSPIRPLTAELTNRPRGPSSRPRADAGGGRRVEARRRGAQAEAEPAVDRRGDAAVHGSGTVEPPPVPRVSPSTRSAQASWVSRTVRTTSSSATSESSDSASSSEGPVGRGVASWRSCPEHTSRVHACAPTRPCDPAGRRHPACR